MNIAAKEPLHEGFHRVLRPGGLPAFQEPMAGPVQTPIFPLTWARDAATSFLQTPEEMRALIEAAGFRTRAWDDVTADPVKADAARPAHGIRELVMGDQLAAITHSKQHNRDEGRTVMVQAIFDRP
jgi:hypothetical protein